MSGELSGSWPGSAISAPRSFKIPDELPALRSRPATGWTEMNLHESHAHPDWDRERFPFKLPAIASITTLGVAVPVSFFVGEARNNQRTRAICAIFDAEKRKRAG